MLASIDGFLKSLSDNGLSDNTIKGYRADLNGFYQWTVCTMGTVPSNLTGLEQAAKNFLNQAIRPGRSANTTRRKVSALRAYGKWLGQVNFLADYRGPRKPPSVPHPLPEGINGVLELMDAAPSNQHRALLAMCGLAGLRVSEARTISPTCIDLNDMAIDVFGKGRKYRHIPLGITAWHYIQPAYQDSMQRDQSGDSPMVLLSDRGARAFITRAGSKVGLLREIASHDLRATFATAAYAKTKDLRAVQLLLGHESSSTTEVYTGVSMEAMRSAAEVI